MTDLSSEFDIHKFLNNNIKDEFSSDLEAIRQTGVRRKTSANIDLLLDDYFNSKKIKSVSAS